MPSKTFTSQQFTLKVFQEKWKLDLPQKNAKSTKTILLWPLRSFAANFSENEFA